MLSKLRKTLRPTKRMAHLASYRLTELPYLLKRPAVGTAEWLIQREIAYGGYVSDVQRRKVSPFDRRSDLQLKFGGMTGGDRMLHHGYATAYARYLRPFLKERVEFGILKSTGDDDFHSSETILTTWRSVMPHLSSEFVYFIEDYAGLLDASGDSFAHCCCHADGELTVITNTSHA